MSKTIGAVIIAAAALASGPALAHAHLEKASPGVGTTVKAPPSQLDLSFSEGVVPKFCGVALEDSARKPVPLGPLTPGATKASLIAPVKAKLAPGVYTVIWHAVAVDTHRTQGTFHFTVAP